MTRAGKKVTWNDIEYPTIKAAAIANNLTYAQMKMRISVGFDGDATLYMGKRSEAIPFSWDGVAYKSITAAAKALNINYDTLYKYYRKGFTGTEDVTRYHKRSEKKSLLQKKQWRLERLEERYEKLGQTIADLRKEIENA